MRLMALPSDIFAHRRAMPALPSSRRLDASVDPQPALPAQADAVLLTPLMIPLCRQMVTPAAILPFDIFRWEDMALMLIFATALFIFRYADIFIRL